MQLILRRFVPYLIATFLKKNVKLLIYSLKEHLYIWIILKWKCLFLSQRYLQVSYVFFEETTSSIPLVFTD